MRRSFAEWIYDEEALRDKTAKEEEGELSVFLEDITVLISDGSIVPKHYLVESDRLYLWFSGIYNTWEKNYKQRKGEGPFGKSALMDYFREEPYYIDHNIQKRIGGTNRRCLVFDMSLLPEHIRESFISSPS